MIQFTTKTVEQWQREGALLVEDGNHGENRPRKDEFADEGMSFIRAADMADGMVLFEQAEKINAVAQRRVRKGIGRPGDIIISHKGTIGRVARVPLAAPDFVCSPQTTFWRVMDEEKINRDFLFTLLRSPSFQELFATRAGETDMAGYVSLTSQRALMLSLPSISIQQQIGRTIRLIDDKIELNRKTAATLEEMARALYRSWFVDFDPVRARVEGLTPSHMDAATAALFPDGFGEDGLPEGWGMKSYSDLIEIHSGGTPKTSEPSFWGGSIPWYSVVDAPAAGKIFVHTTEKTITAEGLQNSPARIVPRGTTILSARGTIGKLAMAPFDMTFNQSCYGLKGRSKQLIAFTYFATLWAVDQLKAMAHGSVFSTITRQTFEGIELPSAPAHILDAFEERVDCWLGQIDRLGRESRTLADLRDTLLPRLMSGELRVGAARELVEEIA